MDPSMFGNPYLKQTKKNLGLILQERYRKHDSIIDRIMHGLQTHKDVTEFLGLITDIYDVGYTTCVEQYREELKKKGLKVKIIPKESK